MDRFAQLHVVSDLHLGGPPNLQIFASGPQLAWLIDELRDTGRPVPIGLVLNGDIVDFIAAPGARAFDPERAPALLDAIFRDPAFSPVFEALQRYLRTPDRTLVLVLGNHDIELAIPEVQAMLVDHLCAGDDAARGRLRIVFDGTGYACQVGGRSVLCVHGNEVDSWNFVNFQALRELIAAYKQPGAPRPEWSSNAGSRLVVDVMNPIKNDGLPFVDLLKPEIEPVLLTLRHLGKSARKHVDAFGPIGVSLARGWAKRMGYLSAEPVKVAEGPPLHPAVAALGREEPSLAGAPEPDPSELLARIEADFRAGVDPLALVEDGSLSMRDLARHWWSVRGSPSNLREALQQLLARDATFHVDEEDETFQRLDEKTSPEVDFLVAGHTHLRRMIWRRRGRGLYFNSGTWIRLIELPREKLVSDEAFAEVLAALQKPTIEELDEVRFGDGRPLIKHVRTVVSIEEQGPRGVVGSLRSVEGDPQVGFRLDVHGSQSR